MKRLVVLLFLVIAAAPGVAAAATFNVNSTLDAVDASPGDGTCAASSGSCTLRAAIQEANADTVSADTITLVAGTYTLSIAGANEDNDLTGDLDLLGPTTITGAGQATTIIDAAGIDRAFHVPNAVAFSLSGVTVTGGINSGLETIGGAATIANSTFTGNTNPNNGGAIRHRGAGMLTLTGVTVTANTSGIAGGGVSAEGDGLTASGIVVTNNTAQQNGGGLVLGRRFASFSITASVIRGNTSETRSGGGISVTAGTGITITASEISDNAAPSVSENGGGINTIVPLTVVNSTISGNAVGGLGGGIHSSSGVTLRFATVSANSAQSPAGVWLGGASTAESSIVAGNGAGAECGGFGSFTNVGHNLQDDDGACGFDITGAPGLAPLAANGGSRTHALVSGSPAIDAAASCSDAADQRGMLRPVGLACDLGAYEGSVALAAPTLTLTGPGSVAVHGAAITIGASAFNGTGGDLSGVTLSLAGQGVRILGFLADAQTGSTSWGVTTPNVCTDTDVTFTVTADWAGRAVAAPSASTTVTELGHCATLSGVVRHEDGTPAAGATVTACAYVDHVPTTPCHVATAGLGGNYRITGIEPGTYQIVVRPDPDRSDERMFTWGTEAYGERDSSTHNFQFSSWRVPVGEVESDSGHISPTGTPSVPRTGTTFRITEPTCDGATVTWTLVQGTETVATGPMHLVNPGTVPATYEAEIPPLTHGGWMEMRITKACPDGSGGVEIFDMYIDPSGFVRDTFGNGVGGATVTLYSAPSASGPWTVVPDGSTVMSPNNRRNPDVTDGTGFFGWDVQAGFYKVVAFKDGCGPAVESAVMQVPPPVTDLDLRLACPRASVAGGGGGGSSPSSPDAATTPSAPVVSPPAVANARFAAHLAGLHVRRTGKMWNVGVTLQLNRSGAVTVELLRNGQPVRLAVGTSIGDAHTGRARNVVVAAAGVDATPLSLRVAALPHGVYRLVVTASSGGVKTTTSIRFRR